MRRDELTGILNLSKLDEYLDESDKLMLSPSHGELTDFLQGKIAQGKRLRPAVLIAAAAGSTNKKILKAAAAVEMVHQASKLHDSVLDDSPSDAYKYLLGGDLLIASGLNLAAECGKSTLNEISDTIAKMIAGESKQARLSAAPRPNDDLYIEVCKLKTASLFEVAAFIGVKLTRTNEETAEYAREYGASFGVAFQVSDDINDGEFGESFLPEAIVVAKHYFQSAITAAYAMDNQPLANLAQRMLKDLSGQSQS